MKTIKAVIFDLDGTLLDTEALSDTAVILGFGKALPTDVKERLGGRLPWELKKQILGLRGSEWVPIVRKYGEEHWGVAEGEAPSLGEFWDSWESNLNDLCPNVKACPGAHELVQLLAKSNIPMAIATSSRKAAVDIKRQKHDLMFQHMKEIVTGDDPNVKNGKPAPDIFIEAARRLGYDPSECIVFEDSLSGVQSGKAAGCVAVAVPDPRMSKSVFEPIADTVLDDLWTFDGTPWGLSCNMKEHLRN